MDKLKEKMFFRTCKNCRYENVYEHDKPCKDCSMYSDGASEFKPKEQDNIIEDVSTYDYPEPIVDDETMEFLVL